MVASYSVAQYKEKDMQLHNVYHIRFAKVFIDTTAHATTNFYTESLSGLITLIIYV